MKVTIADTIIAVNISEYVTYSIEYMTDYSGDSGLFIFILKYYGEKVRSQRKK